MRLSLEFHVAMVGFAQACQDLGAWKARLEADPLHPHAQERLNAAAERVRHYHEQVHREARRPQQPSAAEG